MNRVLIEVLRTYNFKLFISLFVIFHCVYTYRVSRIFFLNVNSQNYKIHEHPFLKWSKFLLSSELVPSTKMYVYAIIIMPKRKKKCIVAGCLILDNSPCSQMCVHLVTSKENVFLLLNPFPLELKVINA